MMVSKIGFISGHRDVTEEEFAAHYTPLIANAVMSGATFVVGDYVGVDDMAQKLLVSMGVDNAMVFHMHESPRNFEEGLQKVGGFLSDVDRDFAMTLTSDFDIAWVRDGKEGSGTAQNIERRRLVETGITDIKEIEARMFI